MKNFKKNIFLCLLLALVCIGGVELAVCSYQSPALYARITAPVRAGFQRLNQTGEKVWNYLSSTTSEMLSEACVHIRNGLEQLSPQPEADSPPEEDIQLVDSQAVAPPPRPRASFTITALASRNGREYLTGGAWEVVYYNQTDESWAGQPYGTDQIGGYGCGPTAMAMAVSTLTDTSVDPAQMARHCVDKGYWAKKHGSYRSIVQGVAEDFGLSCASISLEEDTEEDISLYLSTGQLIVALMGPGHFTNSGHFILLRGITLDGSILVADPASPERSLITWDLELILDELSASRDSGGPLWVLSQSGF